MAYGDGRVHIIPWKRVEGFPAEEIQDTSGSNVQEYLNTRRRFRGTVADTTARDALASTVTSDFVYVESVKQFHYYNGSAWATVDSATLGGAAPATSATADTIVKRDASGNIIAAGFTGSGASITGISAANITAGTLPLARLVGITNTEISASAAIDWTKINKSGSSLGDLTTRSAADLSSGTLADGRLSSNVPLKNTANDYTQPTSITYGATQYKFGTAAGQGSITADNASTTLAWGADWSGTNWVARQTTSAQMAISGADVKFYVNAGLTASSNFTPTLVGTINSSGFNGVGTGLTALNASNLGSGTVPLARLSGITNTEIAAGAAIADTKLGTISTALKVSNSATTATSAQTANAIVARDANGDFSARYITLSGDPVNALHAATKQYVDNMATGLDIKGSVRAATTAVLPTNTRSTNTLTASVNGALPAIDGITMVVGDRVLVKNEATSANNGIYTITSLGAVGAPWTMLRATDADGSPASEVTSGMFTFVEEGTTNADTGWVLTTNNPITLNTSSLVFTQFAGVGTFTAGSGLTNTGTTFDVNVDNSTLEVNSDQVRVKALGITNSHISATAAIADTKLGTISTAGKVSDSALSSNIPLKNGSNIFTVGQSIKFGTAGSTALGIGVSGDTTNKFQITNDGIISFGAGGSTAVDTNLYRSAANTLKTDDDFIVGTNLSVTGTSTLTGNTTMGVGATLTLAVAPSVDMHAATKKYVDDKQAATYVDKEIPTGTINGSNTVFTLANTPITGSDHVYVSGMLFLAGTHYNISGATITFVSGYQPQTGEWIRVSYRK
jgi:hypothetical protein